MTDCILQSSICRLEAFDLALAAAGGLCQRLRFWFVTQRWNKNIALNGLIHQPKDGWRMLKSTTEGGNSLVFQSSFAEGYKSLESVFRRLELKKWSGCQIIDSQLRPCSYTAGAMMLTSDSPGICRPFAHNAQQQLFVLSFIAGCGVSWQWHLMWRNVIIWS